MNVRRECVFHQDHPRVRFQTGFLDGQEGTVLSARVLILREEGLEMEFPCFLEAGDLLTIHLLFPDGAGPFRIHTQILGRTRGSGSWRYHLRFLCVERPLGYRESLRRLFARTSAA